MEENILVSTNEGIQIFSLSNFAKKNTLKNTTKIDLALVQNFKNNAILQEKNKTTITNLNLKNNSGQSLIQFNSSEIITSYSLSKNEKFLVGGGLSGRIYFWDFKSGFLINSFDGHFKKINNLSFTSDGNFFCSCSDDGLCHLWFLTDIFDLSASPAPFKTFQGHSLPVTDFYLGIGLFQHARLFTVSKDRTLRIWSLSTGNLLTTILYPRILTKLVVDPTENHLFVGCIDGKIFQLDLFKKFKDTEIIYSVINNYNAAHLEKVEDFDENRVMIGHSQEVTGMSFSFDSTKLCSSSLDGQLIIWDCQSRQILKVLISQDSPIKFCQIFISFKDENIDKLHNHNLNFNPLKKFIEVDEREKSKLILDLEEDYFVDDQMLLELETEYSCFEVDHDSTTITGYNNASKYFAKDESFFKNELNVALEKLENTIKIKEKLEHCNKEILKICQNEFMKK
ncbi:hypothetical protein HK099_004811 [Clydaea vesicula]|uniref:WD40 repeat-like protein n=1 Tax=Clydaea vesicula TaxID=447962 RepID=A0AAD5TZZ6_9FUNG|nr:hypothetical protein HK099_004811 [Clydaea vesicula]